MVYPFPAQVSFQASLPEAVLPNCYESTAVQGNTACGAIEGLMFTGLLKIQQMPWTLVYLALHPLYCQVLAAASPDFPSTSRC